MGPPIRPDSDEGQHDDQAEEQVDNREDSFRQVVIEQASHPTLDKAGVRLAALPQGIFQNGQGAEDSDQAFRDDEADGSEVGGAEPETSDPGPVERGSDPDRGQPTDHEGDEQEVRDEDEVGEERHIDKQSRRKYEEAASGLFLRRGARKQR